MRTPHILHIDDDIQLGKNLQESLRRFGFNATFIPDPLAGIDYVAEHQPDLILLDVQMPKLSGLAVLDRLKNQEGHPQPVIMLTSRSAETDQCEGLMSGADDYITKPFSTQLLIARIKSVLRRSQSFSHSSHHVTHSTLSFDVLELNQETHECQTQDSKIQLSVSEFLVLEALMLHPKHTKTRQQLLNHVYADDPDMDDRCLDTVIKRLRKKLRVLSPDHDYIRTLYGLGYRLMEPTRASE